MSARIYPIALGARMKPPNQPAKDLLDVNVQLTELQVTSDFTLETCKCLDNNIKQMGARLDNNMKEMDARLDNSMKEMGARLDNNIKEMGARLDNNMKEMGEVGARLDARLDNNMKEMGARLDNNMKDMAARLDNNMKEVGARLDTLTSDHQQLKETVARIDLRIQLLQENNEQKFNHLESAITDIKTEIKGIKAEMKNIISWKDRAVGVLLAFTSLCSAVVSVLVVVRSFF